MAKDRRRAYIYGAMVVLFIIFGVWLAFGVAGYARRVTDERETRRQSEALRAGPEECPVLAARHLTGNDEIIAFLYVPGTAIRYAVVHGADNEFYLTHDLLRQPNENGAVFLDYANAPDFNDPNTIIYGHNRTGGIKFHDLQLFQDSNFFNENSRIYLTTLDGVLVYEIFAVFVTHISFQYIQVEFAGDDDFLSLTAEIKRRARHRRDVSLTGKDRMLILSTCTNIGPTGRLAVAARLLRE